MSKAPKLLLAAGLAASAATVGALTPCDLDVTRTRNAAEMVCYEKLGPKSATFAIPNVAQVAALEACVLNADAEHRAARMSCDSGVEMRK